MAINGFSSFINFKDPSIGIPGNAGLKDQVLALKWIKENCLRFGGNPNNITVFGESAGAASAQYMTISEQARGLFNKVILMSGSVLSPWARGRIDNVTYRLAQLAGYTGRENDEKELYEFYKNIKGLDLVRAEKNILTLEDRKHLILLPFAPIIEHYISDSCVIPEDPCLMMRKAWGNDIPMLIGGVSKEGLLIYPEAKKNRSLVFTMNDCQYLVPLDLNIPKNTEKCKELGLKIKKAHVGDKKITKKSVQEYVDINSYKQFWHSIHRTNLSRLKYSSAETYLYRFDFESPYFNHMKNFWCGPNVSGVCHADDLSYIFYNALAEDLSNDTKEYKTIQHMVNILTHFARYGTPSHESVQPLIWEPIHNQMEPFKCLNISDELRVIDLPEAEKLKTWDSLYPPDMLI